MSLLKFILFLMGLNLLGSLYLFGEFVGSRETPTALPNFSLKDPIAIEAEIECILNRLTLEEKIDLCHAQSKFSSMGVPRLGIPELWMSDGPHGVRAEFEWDSWNKANWTNDEITAFPALTCLASTFNPELSWAYGFALGEEARYRDKDVLLGPGVNIYRTPLNGRNFEYMGEDPYLASRMVVPYIQGVQKNGVAACVKHFALNNQEYWRIKVNVELSDRALHEIYLPAFKAAVQEGGVWTLMGAYNKVRGQYACHNEFLLMDILKEKWGFDGVVISDWNATHDTKEAALNGLDIEMGTGTNGMDVSKLDHYDYYFLAKPFLEAIENGAIDEAFLDDKVRRILRLNFRTAMNPYKPLGRKNNPEHHAVALQVAEEGIVLLKNESNFFPIKDQAGVTIAIIGENATRPMTIGGGSSGLKAEFEISPLEGIREYYQSAKIVHALGYESGPSDYNQVMAPSSNQSKLLEEAIEVARDADYVLFVGGLNKSRNQDCEGGDRLSYGLPFNQEAIINELYEVNPNIGVLLVSGNAVALPWLDKVKGLIQTWYLGSMTGQAIANIVGGSANPSGKLPFTFPKKLTDNGAHYFGEHSYPGVDFEQNYEEGILVGYRWHDTMGIDAEFAFGHGLSYTDFSIEGIAVDSVQYHLDDDIRIALSISNTGKMAGSEVVQVYVGKPNSKVHRAKKELKGFKKVDLRPSETKQITIDIPVSDLNYYDPNRANWHLERGMYHLFVGTASDQILKKIKIMIK